MAAIAGSQPGQVGCGNIWHVDRHAAGRAGRTRHLARRYPPFLKEFQPDDRTYAVSEISRRSECSDIYQEDPRVARAQGSLVLIGITFEILIRMEG